MATDNTLKRIAEITELSDTIMRKDRDVNGELSYHLAIEILKLEQLREIAVSLWKIKNILDEIQKSNETAERISKVNRV